MVRWWQQVVVVDDMGIGNLTWWQVGQQAIWGGWCVAVGGEVVAGVEVVAACGGGGWAEAIG